jgi:hypothetical protein
MRHTWIDSSWVLVAMLTIGCGDGGDGGGGGTAGGGGTSSGGQGTGGTNTGGTNAGGGGSGAVGTGGEAAGTSTGGVGALPGGWTELPDTALESSGVCANLTFDDPGLEYGPTEGCSAVIRDWNGGAYDSLRGKLVFTGGGHTGYYGNELYALVLGSSVGEMTRLNDPTLPTNYAFPNPAQHTHCDDASLIAALPLADDGSTWGAPCNPATQACAPSSRHNYAGLAYLSTTDQLFLFGGYLACDAGVALSDTWLFDFASMTWSLTNAANAPDGYGRAFSSDFDPTCGAKGCVILHDGSSLYRYDVAQNSYSQDASLPLGNSIAGVWDPERKLYIMLGDGALYLVDYAVDPPAVEQLSESTTPSLATCQAVMASSQHGGAYDPVSKKTIFWPNQGGSVHAFDPDTKSCEELAYPGGPAKAGHDNGTFGRFRYAPGPDAFVLVNDYDQNAFLLRIR